MRTLFVLSLRQMLGGKKIWIVGLFLALPVVLLTAVLAAAGFNFPEQEGIDVEGLALSGFLYLMYPQSLCILASLLYGASLLAGEIEDKTLVYLFTRALPRWKVLLGKYLATATALSVLCLASMSIAYALCGFPIGARVWVALAASIVAGCFTFTAIFCLLGLFVPRRALPIGLIYAVLVEFLLSSVPALVNELTASYYIRSLTWHIADLPLPAEAAREFEKEVAPFVAGVGAPTAVLALCLITIVALSISALVIHKKQWPLTEGV